MSGPLSDADPVVDALGQVVRDFGRLIGREPDRVRAFLKDLLANQAWTKRRQIDAIVQAAQFNVPDILLTGDSQSTGSSVWAKFDEAAFSATEATYGIDAWATALAIVELPDGLRMLTSAVDPIAEIRAEVDRNQAATIIPDGLTAATPVAMLEPTVVPTQSQSLSAVSQVHIGSNPELSLPVVRHRWVHRRGLIAAVVVAVVAVVGGVSTAMALSGGGSHANAEATRSSGSSAPQQSQFPMETVSWGATVMRTWALAGDSFNATLDVSNPTESIAMGDVVEVIPKTIATDVHSITFSPQPTQTIAADPIVSFHIELQPHATIAIGYKVAHIPVVAGSTPKLSALVSDYHVAATSYHATASASMSMSSPTPSPSKSSVVKKTAVAPVVRPVAQNLEMTSRQVLTICSNGKPCRFPITITAAPNSGPWTAVHIASRPDWGTATVSGKLIYYAAVSNTTGTDHLTFYLTNSAGTASNTATLTIRTQAS
jgi:hypothetical protein